jgi:hypothetical protein
MEKSNDALERILKDQEKESKKAIAEGRDMGHRRLIEDLEKLLMHAHACAFHDFLNDEYAMPKVALVQRLQGIEQNAKDGLYDN